MKNAHVKKWISNNYFIAIKNNIITEQQRWISMHRQERLKRRVI